MTGKPYTPEGIIRKLGEAELDQRQGKTIPKRSRFREPFWGQGLAQEALKALLAWAGHALSARRILAYAPDDHAASLNVMAKSGMTFLKRVRVHGINCTFCEFPLRKA